MWIETRCWTDVCAQWVLFTEGICGSDRLFSFLPKIWILGYSHFSCQYSGAVDGEWWCYETISILSRPKAWEWMNATVSQDVCVCCSSDIGRLQIDWVYNFRHFVMEDQMNCKAVSFIFFRSNNRGPVFLLRHSINANCLWPGNSVGSVFAWNAQDF